MHENPSHNQKPIKKVKVAESNGSSTKSSLKDTNSIEDGKKMFSWIIDGIDVDEFMKSYWEKKPKLIKRNDNKYYSSLLSMEMIDMMLRENYLEFTKNIDITSYRDGVRETHNPEGRATPSSTWSFFENGCSIRILNPQTFIPAVYKMNSKLQEYFHCMIGTNVYLTPKNTQGFAPHFDDIEAFVLQIEGQKHWRVYEPRTPNEYLARDSSENFSQDEIGEPIMEVILEAGDMLYFPRGFIHQADTVDDKHSLHITVSMYQKNSYADLLEALLPVALKTAIDSDVRFREGLPINIHQVMGCVFSEIDSPERTAMRDKVKSLFNKIFDHANVDNAVDQMSKKYQSDALPPFISKNEKQRTVYGEKLEIKDGEVNFPFEIKLDTNVRLLKANVLRLVEEEGKYLVYFHTENSKEYHEYEPTFMEIDEEDVIVIEKLVQSYPNYIIVNDLPIEDEERKVLVITDLWEKGLLITDENVD